MKSDGHYCQMSKNGLALAAAGVMGLAYVLCAVFVVLWPDFSLQLLGWLVHLVNVEKFAGGVQITVVGFVGGLIQTVLYTYAGAWLVALLHNRFCQMN